MRRYRRTLTSLTLLCLAGCAGDGLPRDRIEPDPEKQCDYSAANQAELIVIGAVAKAEVVGEPHRARQRDLALDLVRVTINVESIIKGEIGDAPLDFYFYAISRRVKSTWIPSAWYWPEPGERRIFFLVRDRGSWRTVRDFALCYAPGVTGGRHARILNTSPDSWQRRICGVLLTPGDRYDPEVFARTIMESASTCRQLTSETETIEFLRRATQLKDQRAAKEATEVLRAYEKQY